MGDAVVRFALNKRNRRISFCPSIELPRTSDVEEGASECLQRDPLLTSGTSFNLRRSRAGKCIISVFSLCSAASPDTGLASTVGLSFAETHGATPGSGRSRPTFANMPAINWLCKCSILGSAVTYWSIWKESSF